MNSHGIGLNQGRAIGGGGKSVLTAFELQILKKSGISGGELRNPHIFLI